MHYKLLLAMKNRPTDKAVAVEMEPFEEYDGVPNRWTRSIDLLPEVTDLWHKEDCRAVQSPAGKLHSFFDPIFYHPMTQREIEATGDIFHGTGSNGKDFWISQDWKDGAGYSTRIFRLPDGWTEVTAPQKALRTLAEFAVYHYNLPIVSENDLLDMERAHKFGWCRTNSAGNVLELVQRTNPTGQFDYYRIGGRWAGSIILKPGRRKGAVNELGSAPCMEHPAGTNPNRRCNAARKRDIDIQGMIERSRAEEARKWDAVKSAIGDAWNGHVTWAELLEREKALTGDNVRNYEKINRAHEMQPSVIAMDKAKANPENGLFNLNIDSFHQDKETHLRFTQLQYLLPSAMIVDGQWIHKGHDDSNYSACPSAIAWADRFHAILDEIPDDHHLVQIDYHN